MLMAVFKTMWLRLWRDKGALILAFILPGFIFAIFAAIFSNASGGDLDLRVAMALETTAPSSLRFADDMQDSAAFTLDTHVDWTTADITDRVKLGQNDVGFVITGDMSDLSAPPITIIKDPSREIAATVLMGQIRQKLADQIQTPTGALFIEQSAMSPTVSDNTVTDQSITYYVGATAILFLLFSAMQGAAIALDERQNGIADRLLVGPMGAIKLLSGKFLFLMMIGTIQAAVIVAVAHVFFNVPIVAQLPALTLACMGTAALASGIALLVASLCGSGAQMNTVSTFIVLLFSAIGGSMVPRFMMPGWLQTIGEFTPNFWAIEAFYGILARGLSIQDLLPIWSILYGGAVICLMIASLIAHKMMRV